MPWSPQKQPPASTAVSSPFAAAAGVSNAGAGITRLIASALAPRAHPYAHAASTRAAARILLSVRIVVSLGRAGRRASAPAPLFHTLPPESADSGGPDEDGRGEARAEDEQCWDGK